MNVKFFKRSYNSSTEKYEDLPLLDASGNEALFNIDDADQMKSLRKKLVSLMLKHAADASYFRLRYVVTDDEDDDGFAFAPPSSSSSSDDDDDD